MNLSALIPTLQELLGSASISTASGQDSETASPGHRPPWLACPCLQACAGLLLGLILVPAAAPCAFREVWGIWFSLPDRGHLSLTGWLFVPHTGLLPWLEFVICLHCSPCSPVLPTPNLLFFCLFGRDKSLCPLMSPFKLASLKTQPGFLRGQNRS